ncbi:BZ3500_MvSof-1268-A1-R1_Chr7-3g09594 [Microbotryum saponariae]|uniref:BZ3500_MvSof-1268-A1-R1_Chr7-3g09594 protein n=1 Tax=Microbotryum saponariae TaxID=289078 RepID=A0A2X0NBC5_9BASI|nr:BZ3501_MvSof-1269-A2-R1_Chr7-2g09317 [Microbotryum saponariae]SDA02257.1 BZ3500_MvSof-1268-A1-R1_Chr7-3g09594 [Microbotryum saponariae]
MAFILHGYVSLLQRYTLPTQMATSTFTSGLGDVGYQQAFEKVGWRNHEFYRTKRMMIYGGLFWAPIANRWHAVLNKVNYGGKLKTAFTRAIIDATTFAPFACCLFYTSQGLLEGRPWRAQAPLPTTSLTSPPPIEGIYERLQDRLWTSTSHSWCLFFPAQIVNMSIMPVYARPPFMSVTSCLWSIYLASAQRVGALPPQEETTPTFKGVKGLGDEPVLVVATEAV